MVWIAVAVAVAALLAALAWWSSGRSRSTTDRQRVMEMRAAEATQRSDTVHGHVGGAGL